MTLQTVQQVGHLIFYAGLGGMLLSGFNTVAGIGANILNPLGKWDYMNRHTDKAFDSGKILQIPFTVLVTLMNWSKLKNQKWCFEKEGYFTQHIAGPIFLEAKSQAATTNEGWGWINRHVVSRVLFVVHPLVSLVMRIVDLVVGLGGALVACLLWGSDSDLNDLVERNLSFFAIIGDVCQAARGVILPTQF